MLKLCLCSYLMSLMWQGFEFVCCCDKSATVGFVTQSLCSFVFNKKNLKPRFFDSSVLFCFGCFLSLRNLRSRVESLGCQGQQSSDSKATPSWSQLLRRKRKRKPKSLFFVGGSYFRPSKTLTHRWWRHYFIFPWLQILSINLDRLLRSLNSFHNLLEKSSKFAA